MEINDLTNFDIRLVYVEKSKYLKDWESFTHTHPFTEVFYCLSGSGYSIIDGKSKRVMKDDIFVVNPNTLHTEYSDENSPLEYIVFALEGLSYQNEESRVIRNKNLLFLREYFELLNFEYKKNLNNRDYVTANLVQIIISHIANFMQLEFVVHKQDSVEGAKIRKIKDYIDIHFKEDITLDDLAKRFKVNKYYLAHLFKDTYGTSPITYLVNIKIKHAKDLLTTSDFTISQISDTLNYSSQSYFCQLFKKVVGVSPNEYRKNYLKNQA